MNEVDVRALVREAVARHFGPQGPQGPAAPTRAAAPLMSAPPAHAIHGGAVLAGHSSHALYLTLVNTSDACVIEPSATCDHCGYCKSHGH